MIKVNYLSNGRCEKKKSCRRWTYLGKQHVKAGLERAEFWIIRWRPRGHICQMTFFFRRSTIILILVTMSGEVAADWRRKTCFGGTNMYLVVASGADCCEKNFLRTLIFWFVWQQLLGTQPWRRVTLTGSHCSAHSLFHCRKALHPNVVVHYIFCFFRFCTSVIDHRSSHSSPHFPIPLIISFFSDFDLFSSCFWLVFFGKFWLWSPPHAHCSSIFSPLFLSYS